MEELEQKLKHQKMLLDIARNALIEIANRMVSEAQMPYLAKNALKAITPNADTE